MNILNINNIEIKIKNGLNFWEIYNKEGILINTYSKELKINKLQKLLISKFYKIIN